MKKGLILLIFITSIFISSAQDHNFDFQVGTKVSISDNEKKGVPNVYEYNEEYKTNNKLRFKPINGQLSSKSDLLGRVFTIEKIITSKFDYKRLLILRDSRGKLLYDYTIGVEDQLIVAGDLSSGTNVSDNEPVYNSNIIREVDKDKFRPNYPDGVYMSMESFHLKLPKKEALIPVERGFRRITKQDTLPDVCGFIYASSEDIVSNCFAVSYNGFLYFRSGAMIKYKRKNDRAETVREANTFSRVLMGGERFFYTEYEFVNQWAAGVAGGSGSVAGGMIYNSLFDQKGVVWDFEKQKFDIFKSCKNYNIFLDEQGSNHRMDCKGGERPNLVEVRAFIKSVM